MNITPGGQWHVVEETTNPGAHPAAAGESHDKEPQVQQVLAGDTVRLTLAGELTGAARRPLVRVLTDLLLQEHSLRRVELCLSEVSFMNSAGMALLVQLQRMTQPRGVDIVLMDPSPVVIRPLQLSGVWHRFPVVRGEAEAHGEAESDRSHPPGVGTEPPRPHS